ncbi:biotin/lipoyl-containing protein [Micromonospora sp. NPDC049101]|uniref:acetyl-CoA carboxylase biotin carboxyl carrier protein n=1 Tax=unclassified Micromonospora TaxID=2617518 RepID=UPI0033C836BF
MINVEHPIATTPLPDLPSPLVAALADEARQLAVDATGRLRSVVLSVGDAQVEIEWAPADFPGTPEPETPEPDPPAQVPVVVTAPTVGVFRLAPEPGAPPLVTPGQPVDPDTPVGLLESMQVGSPVPAGVHGTVCRVLVDDGRAVEYGQPLVEVAAAQPGHAI